MSHFQLCTIHEIVIVALLERQKKLKSWKNSFGPPSFNMYGVPPLPAQEAAAVC